MTVSRRQAIVAGAAALPAVALTAAAQTPSSSAQPGAGRAGAQPATSMSEDPFLAACLLIGGRRQIEVCQFALQRLQDADVKQFATAEIQEHQQVKAELAQAGYTPPTVAGAAGGTGGASGTTGRTDIGRGTGTTSSGSQTGGTPLGTPSGAGATGTAAGGSTMTAGAVSVGRASFGAEASRILIVDQEVHETDIANTKAHLQKCEQKGKTKFDKGFVTDQLVGHMKLLNKVSVFQRHASQEMQPSLAKALGVIQQHIATCEKLMEKLDQQAMREMQGGQRPSGSGSR